MGLVRREEIVDYVTYSERRKLFKEKILKIKEDRRVHVGPYLTFLFENHDTVLYQIQEMMLVEKIVKESDILHEMQTYNELIGGKGEIGCSLLIEIDDAAIRPQKLKELLGLESRMYLTFKNGEKSKAIFDPRQVGEDRISSVQYLKFAANSPDLVGIETDHPAYKFKATFTPAQLAALKSDLI